MSDHLNGSAVDPWTPIKREPLGGGGAKPKQDKAQRPSSVEINVGLADETTAAITALAAAQDTLGEKLEAATAQSVEVTKAIAQHAVVAKDMIAQMVQQTAAMLQALQQLDAVARAIEKAGSAPRKVTLRRDKDGVAVDAISTVTKQ